MSSIFISYRRQGAVVHARALFERLSREFGRENVFIDLDGIEIGVDFVDLIDHQLEGCRVLLALIDPQWASVSDRHGRRKLDNADDFVRIEIERALERGIVVAPILLDGAEIPDAQQLPKNLRGLTRRNALALDFYRFDTEVERLIGMIRRLLAATPRLTSTSGVVHKLEEQSEPLRATQQDIEVQPAPYTRLEYPAIVTPVTNPLRQTGTAHWLWAVPTVIVIVMLIGGYWTWQQGRDSLRSDSENDNARVSVPSLAQPAYEGVASESKLSTSASSPAASAASPPPFERSDTSSVQTTSTVGRRWILNFRESTLDSACNLVESDPAFTSATIFHCPNPQDHWSILFGPTTDRAPLDAIRKRYLDKGVFSVITAPSSACIGGRPVACDTVQ